MTKNNEVVASTLQAWRLVQLATCFSTAMTLYACGSQLVNHAFAFDATVDSPGVEILDYRYGESRQPMARNPEYLAAKGQSLQRTFIRGEMRQGDVLYVKWRARKTGEIFEDTVDLQRRLPGDISRHTLYFIADESQLYVYLIPPEGVKRPSGKVRIGPRAYDYRDTVQIYP